MKDAATNPRTSWRDDLGRTRDEQPADSKWPRARAQLLDGDKAVGVLPFERHAVHGSLLTGRIELLAIPKTH